MTNIESIVKVMNFHALLRVDKSKKKAESFFKLEKLLNKIICEIYYNKNLVLDKKIIHENSMGDTINIYIGNDLGFCGNFNTLVLKELKKDKKVKKIIIGKKITYIDDYVLFLIEKENFDTEFPKIEELIYNYINERKLKEINVIYNHYYNTNDIRFEKTKIFPVQLEKNEDFDFYADFTIETNVNSLLSSLLSYYICFNIKLMEQNSLASENVMREKITHEAITKIGSMNEIKLKEDMKARKFKSFKKQLDNYREVDDEE